MATYCLKVNHLPRGDKKDSMKYLSALVLLYQRILVFYSSLKFPRDLH